MGLPDGVAGELVVDGAGEEALVGLFWVLEEVFILGDVI